MLASIFSKLRPSASIDERSGDMETSIHEWEIEEADLDESKRLLERMLHGKVPPIVLQQQRYIINLQTDIEAMKHRIRIAELKVARVSKTSKQEMAATQAIAKSDATWEAEINELKDQFNINMKQLGKRADKAEEELLQAEERIYRLGLVVKENGIEIPE